MAGDGSITKRAKDTWLVQVSWGKDYATGKYLRASKVVRGTKADARKVRDEMRKERDSGLALRGGQTTFGEFSDKYLDMRRAVNDGYGSYLAQLQYSLNTISKYIGGMELREITPEVVETLLSKIKEDKTKELGHFRNSTLKNYRKALKLVLQKAVDYDCIMRNPLDRTKPLRSEPADRRSLEMAEVSQLHEILEEKEAEAYARLKTWGTSRRAIRRRREKLTRTIPLANASCIIIVRLALATGMRKGEALALKWDCVELDKRKIRIVRSANPIDGVKSPKTPASVRTVSIDKTTAAHLARWKDVQKEELKKLGIEQEDSFVCCNGYGKVMDGSSFTEWFMKFRRSVDFDSLKLHELRNTQATWLLSEGTPIKTVVTRLGHAKVSTTIDIYTSAIPQQDVEAADLIGSLFAAKAAKLSS